MGLNESIYGFHGEHSFLSNFHPVVVVFEGLLYPSVEHAYQAAKTRVLAERISISHLSTAGQAKRAGRRVTMRPDWDNIKVGVMYELLRQKFIKNPELGKLLHGTGDKYLEETNWWGDRFWGVCDGKGENKLGTLLMNIRSELIHSKDT